MDGLERGESLGAGRSWGFTFHGYLLTVPGTTRDTAVFMQTTCLGCLHCLLKVISEMP